MPWTRPCPQWAIRSYRPLLMLLCYSCAFCTTACIMLVSCSFHAESVTLRGCDIICRRAVSGSVPDQWTYVSGEQVHQSRSHPRSDVVRGSSTLPDRRRRPTAYWQRRPLEHTLWMAQRLEHATESLVDRRRQWTLELAWRLAEYVSCILTKNN